MPLPPPPLSSPSQVPVMFGIFLNSYYDIHFNVLGTVYATSGAVITAIYQIVSGEYVCVCVCVLCVCVVCVCVCVCVCVLCVCCVCVYIYAHVCVYIYV